MLHFLYRLRNDLTAFRFFLEAAAFRFVDPRQRGPLGGLAGLGPLALEDVLSNRFPRYRGGPPRDRFHRRPPAVVPRGVAETRCILYFAAHL